MTLTSCPDLLLVFGLVSPSFCPGVPFESGRSRNIYRQRTKSIRRTFGRSPTEPFFLFKMVLFPDVTPFRPTRVSGKTNKQKQKLVPFQTRWTRVELWIEIPKPRMRSCNMIGSPRIPHQGSGRRIVEYLHNLHTIFTFSEPREGSG